MNIQDELTQAIAEAAKKIISKKESLKDYKPTRGGKNQDDFIDLHTIDDKEDPEKEKQVEEKDEVEEGNEFTKAAAKAKLAGENEFEFKGKTYPVEIEKDAAEKILGKKEEVEIEEGFYYDGMSAKDKKRLNDIYKKMDKNEKQTQAAIKKGDAKTVDKLGDEYHKLRMQVVNFYNESAEVEESVELDERVAPNLKSIVNIRREIVNVEKKINAAIQKGDGKTVDKLGDELHVLRKKLVNFYNEGVEIEEGFYYDGMSAKDKKRLNDIYKEMDKNEKQSNDAIKKGDAKTVDKLGKEYHKLRMQVVNFFNEDVELKEFNRLKPDDVRDAYGTIQLKYRSSADIRNAEDKLKKAGINVRKSGDTLEVDSDSPAFKKAKITSSFDSSKREKAIMKVLGESAEKKTEELEENRAIVYNPRMIKAFIKQVEKKFPKYKGEIQQIEKDEIVFPNDDKLRDFFRGAKEVKFVLRDSVEIEESVELIRKVSKETELHEASMADIKKVLAAAKKAGADIKGNKIDFGAGSLIDVSIEKGKIKFDGGMSTGVEYFNNAKDAIMAFESVDHEEALGLQFSEAIDPRKFVLGGDTKTTKSDVDSILSKIFINAKLAKQVEDSEAYKAGYKAKGEGKNPYKKDTADFHLYILGQQSAQSE